MADDLQKLTNKQAKAALLVAEDEKTDQEIADEVGMARYTLWQWKKLPAFAARVAEHHAAFRERVMSTGFADKTNRVRALNTVATALLEQLGQSQYQHVTFVTEDGAHIYGFDVPRLKEFRGTLDDIAKEMGERKTGIELSGDEANPLVLGLLNVDLGKV